MLVGADKIYPYETHEKFVREGERLIENARKNFFATNSNATDNDAIFQIIYCMTYAAIANGTLWELEGIVPDAMSEAIRDREHLWCLINEERS